LVQPLGCCSCLFASSGCAESQWPIDVKSRHFPSLKKTRVGAYLPDIEGNTAARNQNMGRGAALRLEPESEGYFGQGCEASGAGWSRAPLVLEMTAGREVRLK